MDRDLKIQILSFAYKSNSIPRASLLFDVRFIDNPYWVEDLRPLTGMNKNVQDFVFNQTIAQDFLTVFKEIAKVCIKAHSDSLKGKAERGSDLEDTYTIAFGCTGGQHRSVAMVEEAAALINQLFPRYAIDIWHREIDERRSFFVPGIESVANKETG